MADFHEYDFEEDLRRETGEVTRRDPEKAERDMLVLLERIGLPEPVVKAAPAVREKLLLFATESMLSIRYYQKRAAGEYRKQYAMNAVAALIGFLLIGFALRQAFAPLERMMAAQAVAAQVGAIVTGLFGALKLLSESHDFQKYRSNFWQAASDLKERLYRFELEWKGKAGGAGEVLPEFVAAVDAEITAARAILFEERKRFYDALSAPATIFGAALQTRQDVQGQAAAVWKTLLGARLREAALEQQSLADQLTELKQSSAASAEVAKVEAALRTSQGRQRALDTLRDTLAP